MVVDPGEVINRLQRPPLSDSHNPSTAIASVLLPLASICFGFACGGFANSLTLCLTPEGLRRRQPGSYGPFRSTSWSCWPVLKLTSRKPSVDCLKGKGMVGLKCRISCSTLGPVLNRLARKEKELPDLEGANSAQDYKHS